MASGQKRKTSWLWPGKDSHDLLVLHLPIHAVTLSHCPHQHTSPDRLSSVSAILCSGDRTSLRSDVLQGCLEPTHARLRRERCHLSIRPPLPPPLLPWGVRPVLLQEDASDTAAPSRLIFLSHLSTASPLGPPTSKPAWGSPLFPLATQNHGLRNHRLSSEYASISY